MNIIEALAGWLSRPEQWTGPDSIPVRLAEHLYYSGLALGLAALVALPLGLLVGHTGRGAFLAVNSGNAARALPTIGLVVLAVTMFGIGLVPVLLPLVALAVPPILVNTYEGVRQVEAELKDAAKGMGMTGRQVLLRVEMPLALPLILLGLRTAAIQIVSTATIAAFVSFGGLGRFIFDGLKRQEYEVMVAGALLSVLLALGTEGFFTLLQRVALPVGLRLRASAERERQEPAADTRRGARLVTTAVASVVALAVGALLVAGGGANPLRAGASGAVVVGSADFQESQLLAEMYAQALEARGVPVVRKFDIGSREVLFDQVSKGTLTVLPEYNGNLLAYVDKTATAATTDTVNAALRARLPGQLELLESASAEDKDALVVTAATAARYRLTSLADLKPVAARLRMGGPPEFKTRKQGLVGIEQVYGARFAEFRALDTAGPISVAALRGGTVDAVNLFTTDPAIKANGFVALTDPKRLFGAQNVTPLVYRAGLDARGRAALNALSARLDTVTLAALLERVVGQRKEDVGAVARDWLTANRLV